MQITIIQPSGPTSKTLSDDRVEQLRRLGLDVAVSSLEVDTNWPYSAGTVDARSRQIMDAFLEPKPSIILAARGGYGAADLLGHLDWKALENARNKVFVGFSDISALHAALYAKLDTTRQNIKLIHGPMPINTLWNDRAPGVQQLLSSFLDPQKPIKQALSLTPLNNAAFPGTTEMTENQSNKAQRKLFGGCFSVLTNLIGTPYFPELEGHLLFFEDISENPARIIRQLNQWIYSGALDKAVGVILGEFCDLTRDPMSQDPEHNRLLQKFAVHCPLAVWHSKSIGHIEGNVPLFIGGPYEIKPGALSEAGSKMVFEQEFTFESSI